MAENLSDLAKDGVLRAAINTANRALVQQEGDTLTGVSPALARRLAEELDVELHPLIYNGARQVVDAANTGAWDIAFLAIDPLRADTLTFSIPYHTIEATYAVRADSPVVHPDDADQEGVTILASKGSAYELHLRRSLNAARVEHAHTPDDSFAAFANGRGDAVAGVRASLERAFANRDDIRILPAALTRVEQAMVLPGPNNPRRAALDVFVERAITSGFIARELG